MLLRNGSKRANLQGWWGRPLWSGDDLKAAQLNLPFEVIGYHLKLAAS
jgi:hypothetical protein